MDCCINRKCTDFGDLTASIVDRECIMIIIRGDICRWWMNYSWKCDNIHMLPLHQQEMQDFGDLNAGAYNHFLVLHQQQEDITAWIVRSNMNSIN